MSTWASCSWCDFINAADVERCTYCGHDAHRSRIDCQCSRCRDLSEKASAMNPMFRCHLHLEKLQADLEQLEANRYDAQLYAVLSRMADVLRCQQAAIEFALGLAQAASDRAGGRRVVGGPG